MTTFSAPTGYTFGEFFTGRQLISAKVTPLTVSSSGVFTKGTGYDLAAGFFVESIEFEGTADDVEISSANALMRSYMNVKDDFTCSVSEIVGSNGQTDSLNAWVGVDYFLAEAVYSSDGGTTHNLTVQAVCKRRSFKQPANEGKAVTTLMGVPCGLPMAFINAGGTLSY